MKRIFSILCVFIVLAFVDNAAAFYNCINGQGNPIITDNPPPGAKCEYMGGQEEKSMPEKGKPIVKTSIAPQKNEVKKQPPPISMEQLPMTITIRKLTRVGRVDNVYIDATYTNNSHRTIVSFSATVLLKDDNEKHNLFSNDTVLPGETSPKFSTLGPKSLNASDMEILKYRISIINEDGSKTSFEYDNKLKQYN
jgi:hypothetical protein